MRIIILTVARLFQTLPPRLAVVTGCFIGWVLHRVLRFRYRIIHNQLNVVYGKSKTKEELQHLIESIYRHLGLLAFEMLSLPGISKDKLRRRIVYHNQDMLQEALARGKGVLILAGHSGNWELAGIGFALQGHPISAVAKEMKTDIGNVFIELMRDENDVVTIPRRDSMRQIIQKLKRNEVICFMIDQNMTNKEGIFVEFMGQQACTMPALAVLAQRTGAVILPGLAYRDEDLWHLHCTVFPEIKLETGDVRSEELTLKNTQILTRALETMIDQHPEQWLWIHKRWKTRPPDEELSPFDY